MSNKSAKEKTAMQLYQSKEDLEHLAGRIKLCVPGGTKLTSVEALSLAQLSLSTGFDPFIGEIWYIPKHGPHIGIRGYRNRAGIKSTYSLEFRPMTPKEIEDHDVRLEVGDVGYICELYRHDVLQTAIEINKALPKPLIPIRPIIGVGIWRMKYEKIFQYKDDNIPHSKSKVTVAKKRAEADALNRGFSISALPYSDTIDMQIPIANGDDIIEAEVVQIEVIANAERAAEKDKTAREHAGDLFGDEIEPVQPPWGDGAMGKPSPEPTEDPVEETLPKPVTGPEEVATETVDALDEIVAKIIDVIEEDPIETIPPEPVTSSKEEEATTGPLETIRQYARTYSKGDKALAPTGGQLRLLGALCATLGEFGLPHKSLFTLRELVWGDENFVRSHFHAILRYVCEMDDKGDLAKDESGGFVVKEGVMEELTPLLGAEIPTDDDLPF